ncbi:MAG: hypothetical protein F6K56_09575 [Moorea sp. SIO3G5]|nr:hypothetical protein [Moorena sp. SIO3G5]
MAYGRPYAIRQSRPYAIRQSRPYAIASIKRNINFYNKRQKTFSLSQRTISKDEGSRIKDQG